MADSNLWWRCNWLNSFLHIYFARQLFAKSRDFDWRQSAARSSQKLPILYFRQQNFGNQENFPSRLVVCWMWWTSAIGWNNGIRTFLEDTIILQIQGDPKRCVPMKISIVTLIKKLFVSNYSHTLFSLWKTIHQSFNYFCRFLINLWLSQDVFQKRQKQYEILWGIPLKDKQLYI